MIKTLFAVGFGCYPVLATNDDGLRAAFNDEVEDCGYANMDNHVASSEIMDLRPGLYVWEGHLCLLAKTAVRPANRQDLYELGFACPAEPPGVPMNLYATMP